MSTILIVDDRPANREFLVTLLGYAGHRTLQAENGADALMLAYSERPDLIITDILMPTMDGFEFARELRAEATLAVIPVIFYTATYGNREARSLAKAAGVQYVLTKPAEPQAILDMVNMALGSVSVPPETVTKPLLDPLQVVSAKLAAKMGELGGLGRRLEALVELVLRVGSEREPQRLLQIACEAARVIIGAQYAAIGILEERGQTLKYFVTSGLDAETIARIGAPPTGKGILGKMLMDGEPIRVPNIGADPDSVGFPPGHPPMRSFLGVPLASPMGLYGRLYLTEKIGADEFSEEDERMAIALGAQVAVAYENANRYDEIQRHAATLQLEVVERKKAEEALSASKELFRTAFEHSPVGMCLTTLDGKLQQVNQALCNMLGFSQEELQGRHFDDIIHPEDLEIGREQVRRMLSGEALTASFERRYLHRSGQHIVAFVSSALLKDSSRTPLRFVTQIIDITERKRAEERNRTQLERLATLRAIDTAITSSSDLEITFYIILTQAIARLKIDAACVLILSSSTNELKVSGAQGFRTIAAQQARIRMGEGIAGRCALEGAPLEGHFLTREDFLSIAPQLADEGLTCHLSVPLVNKGKILGVLQIFEREHRVHDHDWVDFVNTLAGQAVIAIDNAQLFENLQRSNAELERRVLERTAELNQTNAELEHASRAKDEFLANMSHELRTPLTSIIGLSESLLERRRGRLNEYQERSLETIQVSGRHLLDLITEILDLSKVRAGKFDYRPQLTLIEDLCRSSLAFIHSQAVKKSITLSYQNASSVTSLSADPRRLKQILINLLSNAVKFTPEGGHVTLRVQSHPERERIKFSVIDTGIGIAEEDMQRLFQPFMQLDSTLHRQYDGTGLGLALVQSLTDLHGGSVEVESMVGQGSRFTIYLPLETEAIESEEDVSEARELPGEAASMESKARPGRVLIAEDNAANILTIGDYLESHGYEIVVAQDGAEAIEKAELVNPDIILMDIQMPVLNGLDVMARLRQDPRFVSTPIIALTALAMPGDRERCLEAGATEYMSKPVSLKALRRRIDDLLNPESKP